MTENSLSMHEGQPYYSDFLLLMELLMTDDSDPRVIAVVVAAYIDNYVGEILQGSLPGLNSKLREKMFAGEGVLGPLAAKLDMARAMGVITSDAHAALILYARIRNRFAHHVSITTFDHAAVAPLVDRVKIRLVPTDKTPVQTIVGPDQGMTRHAHFRRAALSTCLWLYGEMNKRFNATLAGKQAQ